MSTSQALVTALKAELRRAGITYAQLARELGLAESSVKRIFARGDMTLARIDEVLAVLRLDFAELARQVAQATPPRRELTEAQEEAVVRDPRLLLTALCVLSQWSVEQIVATYTLSRPQATACLLALHRLGLIELRHGPGTQLRYRLKIDKTFRWRPDGPVMRFFRERAMADYFAGDFGGAGETLMLVHGQLAPAQALQPFLEQLGLGRCQLAVHQHQRLARAAEAAREVVGHGALAEEAHHRAVGPPAEG
ncbi:MAG: helix-turn-helix domain-containing protein, partial [Burkholderiaceae bacterium]|nr:helix-turn-helix domain-containing protein [Burkholderiaceae bacterium]